jgi:hypothetical protein
MNNLKLFTVVLITVLVLSACCGKYMPATERTFLQRGLQLVNFTPGQVDSVQIKLYRAGSNFTALWDTLHYYCQYDTANALGNISFNLDSLMFTVPDTSINLLLYFPSANLTYRVTNITDETTCTRCGRFVDCGSFVSRYSVNDVVYNSSYSYAPMVIKK